MLFFTRAAVSCERSTLHWVNSAFRLRFVWHWRADGERREVSGLVSSERRSLLLCSHHYIPYQQSPNTRGTLKGFNDIPMFIQPRGRDGPSASRRSFFCLNLQRLSRFLKNQEPGAFKWKLLEQIKNILQKWSDRANLRMNVLVLPQRRASWDQCGSARSN